MIKKLFYSKIDSITIAAIIIAMSSLISRILGIFRDRILASTFGASETLDIYYAGFRIPDLIFNLIVLGAITAGFIPVFSGLLRKPLENAKERLTGHPHEEAWKVASNLMNIMALFLILLSGLGIIFAPFVVKILAPGFSPEAQAVTANVTRIMFLSPIFLGISSIVGGVLQSFKNFFVYSLSPIFYNLGIIAGALWFANWWGIYGLAIGVALGAFLHLTVQLPALFHLGFRYKFLADFKEKNFRRIVYLMVSRTFSLAVSQVSLTVITSIASTLAVGSLAVFNLANNLQSFPVSIFGISFAVAAFPTLSALAFDPQNLVKSFSRTFRQILFFILPGTVLLLTLRAQVIRVVLGAGAFSWEDTRLTINTLGFFALSLFAQATIPLMTRIFYARHNSATPLYIGIFTEATNILAAFYFSRRYGVAGLALGYSISNIFNFMLLWLMLKAELKDLDEYNILVSTLKFALASIAAGLAVQGAKLLASPYINMTKVWGVFAQGFFAGLAGILVYIAFCSLFRSEELFNFWEAFKRRFLAKKSVTEDRTEARGI